MEAILSRLRIELERANEEHEYWKSLNYGQELVMRKKVVDDLEAAILLITNHVESGGG